MKSSTKLSNAILMSVLNLARLSNLFYKEEDGHTLSLMEQPNVATKCFITSILRGPILIFREQKIGV